MYDQVVMIQTLFSVEGPRVSFDEVSQVAGVAPTARKRDGSDKISYNKEAWQYVLPAEVFPLYDILPTCLIGRYHFPEVMSQLGRLQASLEPRASELGSYCRARHLVACFIVVIEISGDEHPLMGLSVDFIRFMSELGASIVFDVRVNEELSLIHNRLPTGTKV